MSRMRICFLIDEMESIAAGGTERQILQMAELMLAEGADVQLCVLRNTEWLAAMQLPFPVKYLKLHSFFSLGGLAEAWRLRRWLKQERFDLLQTFFVDSNIAGPILGKSAGVHVVLGSRRNLNHWTSRATRLLQRFSNLFVTRLVANCQAVKLTIAQEERFPAEKIDVVYNGLDVDSFRPNVPLRMETRKRLGISDDEVLVGNVSTLRPIKGTELFLECAGLISRSSPQARFLLVGGGPLQRQLEQRKSELQLGDRFIFAGSQDDVKPYLHAMDLGVLCSESEGFSNSILEYMAAGLACVVTDAGGNREAVADAGEVVPANDPARLAEAVRRVAADATLRRRYSEAALRRVQNFGLKTTQKRLGEYYRGLLHREKSLAAASTDKNPG